jgi:hypothetical protein
MTFRWQDVPGAEDHERPAPRERGKTVHGQAANAGHRVLAPDDAEVHHAMFLLRRARGLDAPSFDSMRVQLRRRVAA